MIDYQPILSDLKKLDYLFDFRPIRKSFFNKSVVGWDVSASSCIRKRYTLERLQEYVMEMDMPVVIVDESGDYSERFKIRLITL